MYEEKAPLADTEVSAGDELTLADLERLHGVEAAKPETFYQSSLITLQDSTLELSEDLQGETADDLELAIEHQRIEMPESSVSVESQTLAAEAGEQCTASGIPGLLMQIGTDTFDLSKKDDISWFEQQFQALFSQALYPYLQRISRTWNSEAEVGAMYTQLEALSRDRAPVEAIMEIAQQVSVYREMTEKERLTAEEIQQTLNRLALLQEILQRYQALFESLR